MDVRKYLNKLDPQNEEHREVARKLAKAKALYDTLHERRHRTDPSLLEAAREFRRMCDEVRRVGQKAEQVK